MTWIDLYRWMLAARCVDLVEEELVARGDAFFQVSGSGHEGSALLARHLTADDWLHCHYRDKALLLARGIEPITFFHGLYCNAESSSAGRQMSAHLSDPKLKVLSIVAPVGNCALQAAGVASAVKSDPRRPIVLCSLGDGMPQEGEVLEAIAEAVRSHLPVLFWIENNGYAISTATRGKTFFSLPGGDAGTFLGLTIHRLDGRDVMACDAPLRAVIDQMRQDRGPAIVLFDLERIVDHTSADDERIYREEQELFSAVADGDPLAVLRENLVRQGVSRQELDDLAPVVMDQVRHAAEQAAVVEDPQPARDTKRALPDDLCSPSSEYRGDERADRLTMREALRQTLKHWLSTDSRVSLYGQDIEDPKGDVFRLTAGLTAPFRGRVINAPLSESTIVGVAIGKALAGEKPVAFIQFADFLPLAFNQIAAEMASMHWRTNGGWECPVILMSPCGGYRPGLGPFHAQTLESVLAHMPGIDLAMPSTAADAAGVLNAAFRSGRPTAILYPKSLLNDRRRTTSSDVERQLVPIGVARRCRTGADLTLVTWGSTVDLCEQTADALASVDVSVDLIDLRWLSPWDEKTVCDSVARSGRLLVVHEDNQTCGFGAEVVATVSEKVSRPIIAARITRPDTFVPCNFPNQLAILPSFKATLAAAAEMLDLDLSWQVPMESVTGDGGSFRVQAVGSSPSDESVVVVELKVSAGSRVAVGDVLACLDCNKANFDLESPVAGVVEKLFAEVGQTLPVGAPMFDVKTESQQQRKRQQVRENAGAPKLSRRSIPSAPSIAAPHPLTTRSNGDIAHRAVGLSGIYTAEGRMILTNADLVKRFENQSDEGIFSRTGIRARRILAEDQSALSLATDAARAALAGEQLRAADLSAVICSTSTPPLVCPSLACLVLAALNGDRKNPAEIPAYDIFAACTGYLYALSQAYDFCQTRPDARVLVLTVEVMSTVVDPNNFDTAILFGDAATATIVCGEAHAKQFNARLHRPVISAKGDDQHILCVPAPGGEACISMDGRKVFAEAVRSMHKMLTRACAQANMATDALDLVVPHQANGRIIDAVRQRLGPGVNVACEMADRGNTSSCSIPLVLANVLRRPVIPSRIGLRAFGGGFTFGAAIFETERRV